MPKGNERNELNATQRELVQEAIEDLADLAGILLVQQKLMNLQDLESLRCVARLEDKYLEAKSNLLSRLWDMHKSEDPNLVYFGLPLNRVFQLCLGRSGDLKLEKIGGRLTPAQKTHLRLLTADLLQEGIDQIKALEQAKEAKPAETEKRAGSDQEQDDAVAAAAKRLCAR